MTTQRQQRALEGTMDSCNKKKGQMNPLNMLTMKSAIWKCRSPVVWLTQKMESKQINYSSKMIT